MGRWASLVLLLKALFVPVSLREFEELATEIQRLTTQPRTGTLALGEFTQSWHLCATIFICVCVCVCMCVLGFGFQVCSLFLHAGDRPLRNLSVFIPVLLSSLCLSQPLSTSIVPTKNILHCRPRARPCMPREAVGVQSRGDAGPRPDDNCGSGSVHPGTILIYK